MVLTKEFGTVWIPLTYDCNNKCKWCYAASNLETSSNSDFPTEKEDEVLRLLSSIGVKRVILIGGEPTLYRNLGGFLEKIIKSDMHARVISNGRIFSNRYFTRRIKKTGLNYLTISLCGSDAKSHDNVTGVKGSFEQSMGGIRTASEEGIKVATNTVIGKSNVNDLTKIVDVLENEPVTEITFNICGVCASEDSNNSYLIKPSDAVKSFENVYSYAKEHGIRARLVTPIPLCFFDKDILPELRKNKLVRGGPCQLTSGKNFVIEYNGDIVPCTHLAHFPMMNIFNNGRVISNEEFLEKYNDPKGIPYQFRKKINRYPSTKCERPNCNESCGGGCPLYWLKFDPNKEIKGMGSK